MRAGDQMERFRGCHDKPRPSSTYRATRRNKAKERYRLTAGDIRQINRSMTMTIKERAHGKGR